MNDIPQATSANFAERVRETIQIMLGKRGDSLDRVVTLRDLVASGFASVRGSISGASPIPLTPGTALADTPDMTPPPTPTNTTPRSTQLVVDMTGRSCTGSS